MPKALILMMGICVTAAYYEKSVLLLGMFFILLAADIACFVQDRNDKK